MTSPSPALQEGYLRAELLAIWKPLLNASTLGVDDDFFEKGGDSLLATEMVQEAERRLGVAIPDSLLFEASTARRLAEALSRSSETERKLVFSVTESEGATPLLFFHGDWTNGGFYLKDFARVLGHGLPLAGVAPHGIGGEPVPASLREMAAGRLPHILQFQPHGPFRLAGHCVGGMVALETARLLLAAGHDVELVAMINPIWTAAGQPWPLVDGYVEEYPAGPFPEMTATPESWQCYAEALASYAPDPLPAPLLVLASKYDGKPWRAVSPDFTLFEQPGTHFDFVTHRADVFAAHVREHLKRVTDQIRL
jgi:thioesterase domain-containing protein/acyl carrier protein